MSVTETSPAPQIRQLVIPGSILQLRREVAFGEHDRDTAASYSQLGIAVGVFCAVFFLILVACNFICVFFPALVPDHNSVADEDIPDAARELQGTLILTSTACFIAAYFLSAGRAQARWDDAYLWAHQRLDNSYLISWLLDDQLLTEMLTDQADLLPIGHLNVLPKTATDRLYFAAAVWDRLQDGDLRVREKLQSSRAQIMLNFMQYQALLPHAGPYRSITPRARLVALIDFMYEPTREELRPPGVVRESSAQPMVGARGYDSRLAAPEERLRPRPRR